MTDMLPGTQQAAAQHAASGAQIQPAMQNIAAMVATGAIPMPTTTSGWEDLVRQFANAGQAPPRPLSPVIPDAGSVAAVPQNLPSGGQGDVNKFLAAVRQHESGGNYTAYNAGGGASGAYQFIQSTWRGQANAAGFGEYANGPASAAPPAVQDAVARYMATKYFNSYGSWKNAAEAWYMPSMAGNPADQNMVPYPSAGNTETVGAYGNQIVNAMGAANNGTHLGGQGAINFARSALGTPYVWGGESTSGYDCSGLTQAAYKAAGVNLPRVAQAQYDATTKVPQGQALQPGDLVFYGADTSHISHVGIFIGNDQMIDAPQTGSTVRVQDYRWPDFVGATRPTSTGDPGTIATSATSASPAPNSYAILEQLQSVMNAMGAT